jgi:hypothetical protein
LLDQLRDTREIFRDVSRSLELAEARGMVVAGVMAAAERTAPASTGRSQPAA